MTTETQERISDVGQGTPGTCNSHCQKMICAKNTFDPEFSLPPDFFHNYWQDNSDVYNESDKNKIVTQQRSVS